MKIEEKIMSDVFSQALTVQWKKQFLQVNLWIRMCEHMAILLLTAFESHWHHIKKSSSWLMHVNTFSMAS